jgi:hypothetical protein
MPPTTPPVYETAPSDIPNPDASVTASVASPAGTTPPVSETASTAATVNKLPNPVLEPRKKLRFSDDVLEVTGGKYISEVTLKLTNPTKRRMCAIVSGVGANDDVNQRYSLIMLQFDHEPLDTLGKKKSRVDSVQAQILKMQRLHGYIDNVCPDWPVENWAQREGVWQEAKELGLTTHNRLECVFEPPVSKIIPTPALTPVVTPTPAVTSSSVMSPTSAVMSTPAVTSTTVVTLTPVTTPTSAVTSTNVEMPTSAVTLTPVVMPTPAATPTPAVMSTPVVMIPTPSVTPDQQREQILQMVFYCQVYGAFHRLKPEQELQIHHLAISLYGPCLSCKREPAITCSVMHAARRLGKKYRPDSDSD